MILTEGNIIEDQLSFSDEEDVAITAPALPPWKVLVIDDDPNVHEVTRLVLRNFIFEGASLELLNAYSGQEGKELITHHPDAALMLLDVSMETDHVGLDLVKHVREDLKNFSVRIVLRTGQPGMAPEEAVIARYDINDYKEKTELTARKMFSLMYSCLRGYRDLMRLENNKRGLEQIIHSTANLYKHSSIDMLSSGVLGQLDSLLNLRGTVLAGSQNGSIAAVATNNSSLSVIAGTGSFTSTIGHRIDEVLPDIAIQHLNNFLDLNEQRQVIAWEDKLIGLFRGNSGSGRVVYISGFSPKTDFDTYLINLYLCTAGDSIENLMLREEIEDTQRELIYRLGDAVETRSKESGNHVKRVAELSYRMALLVGMSEREATLLKYASPMHDVGKIGIPDMILGKPGRLESGEWEVMKRHTIIGHQLLSGSSREILTMSSVIALEHHEKWDGSGYPSGKRGEEIHIAARITAIVDVFDALGSRRCYKEKWEMETITQEMASLSGKHFDPNLLDIFFKNLDHLVTVRAIYPDED